MLYLDTSVLVPLFVPEPTTAAVRRWLDNLAGKVLVVSDWTLTEFASALGIKVRERRLRSEQARQACVLMNGLAAESLQVVTPGRPEYERASQLLLNYRLGLRAGDALHLAISESARAEAVYSLDQRFIAAGRKLNFKTASPI
jgi:uncharacterized protein